jgi:hypothetical protein
MEAAYGHRYGAVFWPSYGVSWVRAPIFNRPNVQPKCTGLSIGAIVHIAGLDGGLDG